MKNLSIIIGDKGEKPKDCGSKLNVALKLSRLDFESSAILAVNKVGTFFQAILPQINQSQLSN